MAADDRKLRASASLYVGDLHPEVTKKDLEETFARAGPVLSVRLCRDKLSGKSLCYAYVNYWFHCHASAAVKRLNHTILKGQTMRIMWRQREPITRKNNTGNLFVKNLDYSITSARLEEIFSEYGTVLSCKVAEEKGISKGFGFVQFDSEDSAVAAIDDLHGTLLEGKRLYVSKFLRKSERKPAGPGFRNLYVKNLDKYITEDLLKDKFSENGKVSSAVIMKDKNGISKGYGFVNFVSHEAAQKALEVLNGKLFGSKNIIVRRAHTKAERKKYYRQMCSNLFVKNLHTSVDDRKLERLFSRFGKVISAKVIRNSEGLSKEFGFVQLSCTDEAKFAVKSLIGAYFEGRALHVSLARHREQEPGNLQKSDAEFLHQPLYISKSDPLYDSPVAIKQQSPWYTALYQNFATPFNLLQAQNFQGILYAFPMQIATWGGYRYLDSWTAQKPSSKLQNKIISGDANEFSKGSGGTNTYFLKSSSEIFRSGYKPQSTYLYLQY